MNDWYAYTGETLIHCHGRMIRALVPNPALLAELLAVANGYYHPATKIPKQTFIAALLPPLTIQKQNKPFSRSVDFSSLKQLLEIFSTVNIEQATANFANGRLTSAYHTLNADSIADKIMQDFVAGKLLLPNSPELHSLEILNSLPGIIPFLLQKQNNERKAFSAYLRRGAAPADAMINPRPVLPSFARELRLGKSICKGDAC